MLPMSGNFAAQGVPGVRPEWSGSADDPGQRTPHSAHSESHMLVLSRQRDESIMIGDNVVVTIVDVRGDRVRLGIEAPREISVHRREVYEAIQRENRQASQIRPDQARRVGESQ